MNDTPDHVRIFMVDQTSFDAVLTVPWEVLCNMLLTHGCLVTSTAFINRQSIVRMVRFNPAITEIGPPAQIIDFPTPKGTA